MVVLSAVAEAGSFDAGRNPNSRWDHSDTKSTG